MDLGQFELVPGVITNVDDPEKLGRIKCSAKKNNFLGIEYMFY